MQFLVIAYDGTDAHAAERRRSVRPDHLDKITPRVERGEIRAAGAILDDAGHMIGSTVIAEFPSRTSLDAWLEQEPYLQRGVWKTVEARPFRIAVLDGAITP